MSTDRIFEDRLARREQVPLLVGLIGPSGSGKTYSALELATGIQSVTGGDIGYVDTEAKRALHYADRFTFRHLPFGSPFNPGSYLAAIEHFVRKGCKVIVVDSMSHEHEGTGGVLEMHEQELDRLAGSDYGKRERVKMLAWAKPKAERRRLINSLLQLEANFIFCFRAKEKLKLEKGKEPLALGWQPIAGEEFVYEMTVNCLLLPNARGIPTWETEFPGERQMLKLPEQFVDLFREERALSRQIGRSMAEWARGGASPSSPAETSQNQTQLAQDALPAPWADWTNLERGENRARQGTATFRAWWKSLTKEEQAGIPQASLTEWKKLAEEADKGKDA